MGIAFLAGNEQSANECVKKQLECAISLGPMLRAETNDDDVSLADARRYHRCFLRKILLAD